jgi:exopolyphosphatase/guanosine-5'-triphosphate,3'-diphosphate pyrophosphatase
MCGLGTGLGETGRLHPEGRERALAALKRFALLGDAMGIRPLSAVATAAVRDAEDGPDFRTQVERETGIRLWVVDGREEARLSAQGVLLGWPEACGLICDIGGSSMEVAEVSGGRVGRRETSALGPLALERVEGGRAERRAVIDWELSQLASAVGGGRRQLYLVGGSWRAIAKLDMARRDYPLTVLHEYRMTPDDLRETVEWIAEGEADDRRKDAGVGSSRMALVPLASEVLGRLLETFEPASIAVSSYGIREGLLYEQMPLELRQRDPLIEACRFWEAKDARMPGFGRALFGFLRPLYEDAPERRLRLVRAACLLHDVSWRAHPDYRAEVGFEGATRANLGGLTHEERIFLGLALMHRYTSRVGSKHEDAVALLSEEERTDARRLGLALRFGAMLSVADPDKMGSLEWHPKKPRLTLHLRPETRDLYGEVVRSRFEALAQAWDAEAEARTD